MATQTPHPTRQPQRQLPIAPSPRQPLHWLHASFARRASVVPAKAGTTDPCLRFDVGAVREPPEGHATPNVSPQPTTTAHCAIAAPALTLIACVIHAPSTRRSREGGNLESLLPVWDVGAVREPPKGHAIPNVPPNPTTTAHCAIAAIALTLIAYVIHAPSTRRPRESGRNPLSPLGEG